ncbi:Tat pathway signal protein [Caulobacter sp. 17J65-9]|uniref:Tat pathway signal protein n=1 Tax=Caulobacter sp. 17J65-9 TaxID=2709382 RepID=UPI0013CC73D3|nr:Tat pathway signal protein [Caulobacter sp. 17J65-9]NEX94160.1 Tat pathway signal protein [Caulobacter sp. 17J65-9]
MRRRLLLVLPALLAALPGAAHASGAKDKKKGGGASFVQLAALTANVMRPDGRPAIFTVEAGLDVPDPVLKARVESLTPRLRAGYMETLQQFATGLGRGAAPDADRLAAALQASTDRTLGRKGARLLLGTVMVH